MPQVIEFFVPWVVAPKQTKGNQIAQTASGKQFVRNFTPKDVRDNERQLLTMLEKHKPGTPMRCPVRASYSFRYAWRASDMRKPKGCEAPRSKYGAPLPKDTKPDLGNCIKQIEDCLERGGFIVNDSQIAAYGSVEKVWTDTPGVMIKLEEMEVPMKK